MTKTKNCIIHKYTNNCNTSTLYKQTSKYNTQFGLKWQTLSISTGKQTTLWPGLLISNYRVLSIQYTHIYSSINRVIVDTLERKYRYRYRQYFQQEVMISISAIIFGSIINKPDNVHSINLSRIWLNKFNSQLTEITSYLPIMRTATGHLQYYGGETSNAHVFLTSTPCNRNLTVTLLQMCLQWSHWLSSA